jgi:S1-C subfamily serine protease
MNEPLVTAAGPFQTGSLCPACQGTIADGDGIVVCPSCSMAQHAGCWTQTGRCSSYHCDPRTTATDPARPEIVVTRDEVARVVLPPKRVAPSIPTEDVAAQYLPPPPTTWSKAAFVAVGLSALSFSGAALLFLSHSIVPLTDATRMGVVAVGLLVSLIAGILGAVATGSIQTNRTLRGTPLALASILFSAAAAGLFVLSLVRVAAHATHESGLDLRAPDPPSAEIIASEPPQVANAMRANVLVSGSDAGAGILGMAWCGAGVVLGSRNGTVYILTNHHVASPSESDAKSIEVTFVTGEKAPARVDWLAPEGVDLGVLACHPQRPTGSTTRLATTPPPDGEKVFAIGNPLGLSWTYTEGVVEGLRKEGKGSTQVEVIQTGARIQPGNSGGGLYRYADGALLGVNTWNTAPVEGRGPGFAISSRTIAEVLPSRYRDLMTDHGEDGR